MVKYIKNRVRSYLSGIAKQCVEDALTDDRWGQVADELATRFTAVDIAGCVSPEDIAQHVDLDRIKDYCVDLLDVSEVAENFSACEIACEIDISEIASEVEVDASELAEYLDYRMLAMQLLKCVKGGV